MNRFLQPIALALVCLAGAAQAQVLIDQNKVMAGNVTAGDASGFPLTLSQPGHYKLTGPLTVPAGVNGVEITGPDVTLDLNGFAISGPNSCSQNSNTRVVTCTMAATAGYYNGVVHAADGAQRFALRNGSVRGFTGRGVVGGDNIRLENLNIAHNAGHGYTSSTYSQTGVYMENVAIETNAGTGVMGNVGMIVRSRIASNGSHGVYGNGLMVQDSSVRSNFGTGATSSALRGTLLNGNGTNRNAVVSMGGNLDGNLAF